MFIARVFAYPALRCHLTAQQQDKADEERDANNRRRSQRREILQQGALLSCCLAHRRILPTLRRGAPPCMCLTQVLKYSYCSLMRPSGSLPKGRHAVRWRFPVRSGPHGGARRSPHGSRTRPPRGDRGPCREPAGSGRNQPSLSIVSHRPIRGAAGPALARGIRDGPARRGPTDALSQVRAYGPDDRRSLRPRPAAPGPRARPGSPSRRPRPPGAGRPDIRLVNGPGVAGSEPAAARGRAAREAQIRQCSTPTSTSTRSIHARAAGTATSRIWLPERCARASAWSAPETSLIPRGQTN